MRICAQVSPHNGDVLAVVKQLADVSRHDLLSPGAQTRTVQLVAELLRRCVGWHRVHATVIVAAAATSLS